MINAANADHPTGAQALVDGLEERLNATGKKCIIVHVREIEYICLLQVSIISNCIVIWNRLIGRSIQRRTLKWKDVHPHFLFDLNVVLI